MNKEAKAEALRDKALSVNSMIAGLQGQLLLVANRGTMNANMRNEMDKKLEWIGFQRYFHGWGDELVITGFDLKGGAWFYGTIQ